MKRIMMSILAAALIAASAVTPAAAAWPQGAPFAAQSACRFPGWLCAWLGHGCAQQSPGTDADETPEQDGTPETDAPTDAEQGGAASALETRVAELVNEQRAAYGLPALTLSQTLCDGARLKSQDMLQNGYFSHESPTYGTPFAMMQSLGITYRAAGENIAMGYSTAEAVMNAWMNSEGHRANILSESYTQIGVGYAGGYWTQWFLR